MLEVVKLSPLLMSESSIAGCGEVLGPKSRAPDFGEVATRGWAVDFRADGRTQLMWLNTDYLGARFTQLEYHNNVSQAFIHTGGPAAVVAVAPPSARPPEPAQVRALLIEPGMGYVLRVGAWHSLDRHPVTSPGSTFVMVTCEETTADLKASVDPHRRHTVTVDYLAEFGVTFEFAI
jgi:ureidoglycolate hydrolase